VPFVACGVVAIPDKVLTLPILAAFTVSLLHFVFSYRLRVAVPFWQMIGAMVVFMSVQWTVASAVSNAVVRAGHNYFHRTRKGGVNSARRRQFPALGEGVLGALLVAGAIVLCATNIYRVFDVDLFALVLLMQAMPFLSAVGLAVLERLRVNDLAYCCAVEARPAASHIASRPAHHWLVKSARI
jgi:hypothetical protein